MRALGTTRPPRSKQNRWVMTGLALVLTAGLAGCGSSDAADDADASSDASYPLTVKTSHGDVTIEKAPQRVVALGAATADELISLGIAPVKVAADPDTVEAQTPWMADELAEIADGSLMNDKGELNVEAVAAAEPDLIIGEPWQVADKGVFDQLNDIAPTVSAASQDLNVNWDVRLLKTAEAVDRTDEAKTLISQIQKEFAAVGDTVPDISSKTYQWVRVDPDAFGFGNGSMFELFGLKPAENQDNSQNGAPLSKEKTSELDADLLAIWAPTEDLRASLDDDKLFQALPAVKNGTAYYAGLDFAIAINSPAPMALRWIKDQLKPTIEALG